MSEIITKKARLFLLPTIVVIVAAVIIWRWQQPPDELQFVSAGGRIEGRITTLTAKSSATVISIDADEGEHVSAGRVLARLDDDTQRARIDAVEAQLESRQSQLRALDLEIAMLQGQTALRVDQAEAAIAQADAEITRTHAACEQATRDAERYRQLAERKVVPQQKLEEAETRLIEAEEACNITEAAAEQARKGLAISVLDKDRVTVKLAQRDTLIANIDLARASLAEQQSYIAAFEVKSPINGTVMTRTIEKGERINAGMPLFTLVNLEQLYVKIYVPEPQIGLIALGQKAEITVDAYPDRVFAARVGRVAQQAEFTPKNVETREERVKLVFAVQLDLTENPGGLLKPGMPADALLPVQLDAGAEAGIEASHDKADHDKPGE